MADFIILVGVISVFYTTGIAQSLCTTNCKHGLAIKRPDGECGCRCFFRYSGPNCDIEPRCTNVTCLNYGELRGDCTCSCKYGFSGENCNKQRCPYTQDSRCDDWTYSTACYQGKHRALCPYRCNRCLKDKMQSCDDDVSCHISPSGCKYLGVQPSKEMCRTLGNNGYDTDECLKLNVSQVCDKCQKDEKWMFAHCPVMCGLCRSQDHPSNTKTQTLPKLSKDEFGTTYINRKILIIAVASGTIGGIVSTTFVFLVVCYILARKSLTPKCFRAKNEGFQMSTNTTTSSQFNSEAVHEDRLRFLNRRSTLRRSWASSRASSLFRYVDIGKIDEYSHQNGNIPSIQNTLSRHDSLPYLCMSNTEQSVHLALPRPCVPVPRSCVPHYMIFREPSYMNSKAVSENS